MNKKQIQELLADGPRLLRLDRGVQRARPNPGPWRQYIPCIPFAMYAVNAERYDTGYGWRYIGEEFVGEGRGRLHLVGVHRYSGNARVGAEIVPKVVHSVNLMGDWESYIGAVRDREDEKRTRRILEAATVDALQDRLRYLLGHEARISPVGTLGYGTHGVLSRITMDYKLFDELIELAERARELEAALEGGEDQ